MTGTSERAEQIRARRFELLARMTFIEQELATAASPDWEDNATEHELDESLATLGASAKREVQMLDAALGRIEAGAYGFCMTCGSPISEARLDLLPATPWCSGCAP